MLRREWLAREPFTLALGAGFFGFFSHAGCLVALEEVGLRPRRIVGVSAGALAGGLWASGLSAHDIARELLELRREDFWDPGPPLGGFLRGRKFSGMLRNIGQRLGVTRLEECKIPFTAIVHDVLRRQTLGLDCGPIEIAIRASCAVPLMFRPVWHEGRLLVDGGVSDRCGLSAVDREERLLLHHLPSRRRIQMRRPVAPTLADAKGMLLVTPRLPRVTPFHLEEGRIALERTRSYVRTWLDDTFEATPPKAPAPASMRGSDRQPTGTVFGDSVPSQPQWKLSRKT